MPPPFLMKGNKMGFTFRDNDKLEICGKLYEVDFGNKEVIVNADKKINELVKLLEKYQKSKNSKIESVLDKVKDIQKEIVEIILGVGAFDELWEKSGHNFNKMTELIMYAMKELSDNRTRNIMKYV